MKSKKRQPKKGLTIMNFFKTNKETQKESKKIQIILESDGNQKDPTRYLIKAKGPKNTKKKSKNTKSFNLIHSLKKNDANQTDLMMERVENAVMSGMINPKSADAKNKTKQLLAKTFKLADKITAKPSQLNDHFTIDCGKKSQAIKMPYKPYTYQTDACQRLYKALEQKHSKILFESPTGTGKTQVLLSTVFSFLNSKAPYDPTGSRANKQSDYSHRVLYFTRTISQMSQVISEAKKCRFRITGCVLASRKHMCLNKEALAEKTLPKMNKKCKSLLFSRGCMFQSKFSSKGLLGLGPVMDIEDWRSHGHQHGKCPFFLSRTRIRSANLVVLSYNYMSDPCLRDKLRDYFRGSIVVIDEGHNVSEVFERSASFEYSLDHFKQVIKEVESIKKKLNQTSLDHFFHGKKPDLDPLSDKPWQSEVKFVKSELFHTVCGLAKLVRNISNNLETLSVSSHVDRILSGSKIVGLFELDSDLVEFDELQTLFLWLEDMDLVKNNFLETFLRLLLRVVHLHGTDPAHLNDYKVCMSSENKFKFMCMNPALSFKSFLNHEQACNILMSGTLRPFQLLEAQLDCKFEAEVVACPDIDKWKKQLMLVKMENLFSFAKGSLQFKYKTRNDQDLLRSCLRFVDSISRTTTEGVLVFLPSYNVLHNYRSQLFSCGHTVNLFKRNKSVFFEDKENNSELFIEYRVGALTPGQVQRPRLKWSDIISCHRREILRGNRLQAPIGSIDICDRSAPSELL